MAVLPYRVARSLWAVDVVVDAGAPPKTVRKALDLAMCARTNLKHTNKDLVQRQDAMPHMSEPSM